MSEFFQETTVSVMRSLPPQYTQLLTSIGFAPEFVGQALALNIISPAEICTFLLQTVYVTEDAKQTLDIAMATAMNDTYGETLSFGDLCLYVANVDAVRGLSLVPQDNEDKLEQRIIDSWYGKEFKVSKEWLSDNNLKEEYLGYKAHYYKSIPTAYHVDEVSDDEIIWTGFYNFSGSGPSATYWPRKSAPTMPKIVHMFHNSVLNEAGVSISNVKYQNIVKKFKCNRDEWITGKELKLECDMLPDFLNRSIPDLVFLIFMSLFMTIALYFPVSAIVYEKEHRLRSIMGMMGLSSPVYWFVTYFIELIKYEIMFVSIQIVGYLTDLRVFVIHDQFLIWFVLFLWGNLTVVMSICISNLFKSTRTANAITILFILVLQQMQSLVQNNLQLVNEGGWYYIIPQSTAISITYIFSLYAFAGVPISFQNFFTIWNGELGVITGCMFGHWVFFALLAFYLENASGNLGKLWCLRNSWWVVNCKSRSAIKLDAQSLKTLDVLPKKMNDYERPHDVEKEHQWVVSKPESDSSTARPHIRVINLHKVFGKGAVENVAVKSLSFGVRKNECFGLLGHNGAGKTTAINILTGTYRPDAGSAFIENFSIESDLKRIYEVMGVCPQHDILWPNLSAKEHLEFFARLKGYSEKDVQTLVDTALDQVNLKAEKMRYAGGYSGGMKRRLSMANALVGKPDVIYMDEPSTGLDPASKHRLWDVITSAKGSKSMILTTHSMEEADVLCDRIGIMACGELQCVGRSFELKKRFGKGYTLLLMASEDTEEKYKAIHEFVIGMFPTATLLDEPIAGMCKYEVSRNEVVLSKVFERLIEAERKAFIVSWGFTETTLEEVFLKLATIAEVFDSTRFTFGAKGSTMKEKLSELEDSLNKKPASENIAPAEDKSVAD